MSALSPVDHRGLLTLAWPIGVSMVSYSLLAFVNSVWVGQLGTAELAAIGVSGAAVYLVQAVPMGLSGGLRTFAANRTGASDLDGARALGWDGLTVSLVAGVVGLLLVPFGPLVFAAMGASEQVAPLAARYYAWRVAASPVVFASLALTAWYQGRGDTRTPMVANVLANAVNFVLDPLLIFGWGLVPALGIDGAAIGAGLGQLVGLGWLVGRAQLGAFVAPHRGRLAAVWRLGSPTALQYLLDVASYAGLSALLAVAGDVHLAAHVLVVRVAMLSFLPCFAVAEAVSVLVGQSLGAEQPARARLALRLGVAQTTAVMVALGVLFVAFPTRLTALFGAADDVTSIAIPVIVLYGLLQPFDAVAQVLFGALNGAGDTRYTMRMGLAAAWLVKLPVAALCVLVLRWGVFGAWVGFAAEVAFQLGTAWWRVSGRRWLEAPRAEAVAELAVA